jgi:hypothetical protein
MLLETFGGFLLGIISQSQILSHVTRRLVDGVGAQSNSGNSDHCVVIELRSIPSLGWTETLLVSAPGVIDRLYVAPAPERVLVLRSDDDESGTLFVGVMLDGIVPALSWVSIREEVELVLDVPVNAVGVMLGLLTDTFGGPELKLLEVQNVGDIYGCRVLEALTR